MLAEKLLVRKHFIPDPQGSSLMFAFFAQHFTHQFFKSDMKKGPAFTKAQGHGVRDSDTWRHFLPVTWRHFLPDTWRHFLPDTWRADRGALRSTR